MPRCDSDHRFPKVRTPEVHGLMRLEAVAPCRKRCRPLDLPLQRQGADPKIDRTGGGIPAGGGGVLRSRLAGILAAAVLAGCAFAPYDDTAVERLMSGPNPPVFHQYEAGGHSIHYAETGDPGKPRVVFIHGTPGSWRAFAGYLADVELTGIADLVAVDRPGFGESDPGRPITSLRQQALLLHQALGPNRSGCKAVLVGHSLGAPVAARMAMEFPDAVGALVLVAPSLDPALEKPRWYNRLAQWPVVKYAVPKQMALANVEIMALAHELELMLPLWKTVRVPTTVIQGDADYLVSPANAGFAARVLNGRVKIIRVPDAGHFILWEQPDIIRRAIKAAVAVDTCGGTEAPLTAMLPGGGTAGNRVRRLRQATASSLTAAVIAGFANHLGSAFP